MCTPCMRVVSDKGVHDHPTCSLPQHVRRDLLTSALGWSHWPTSAPGLAHICSGTGPHPRRDSATSAPGLAHICAGTRPHLQGADRTIRTFKPAVYVRAQYNPNDNTLGTHTQRGRLRVALAVPRAQSGAWAAVRASAV